MALSRASREPRRTSAAEEDLKADPLGAVAVKRMFGGFGVFAEGLCFAIALRGEVFLKTDALSRADFAAAGSTPFVYVAKGKPRPTSYWRLPAPAHEDDDVFRRWASMGLEAARRTAGAKVKENARRATSRAKAG